MLRRPLSAPRRGTATVELALVMLFVIVPLILGLWEMGRYVQVQQIVANSAREGARMAAQAVTINASGSPTQILAYSAPGSGVPNVKAAVMQYLAGAGLSRLTYSDVDVTFTFLAPEAGDPPTVSGGSKSAVPRHGHDHGHDRPDDREGRGKSPAQRQDPVDDTGHRATGHGVLPSGLGDPGGPPVHRKRDRTELVIDLPFRPGDA
jgi:TadE-like protein